MVCSACPAFHGLFYFVGKFGKKGFLLATFLEVKIDPVIDCLYDDLLPSTTGEKDKG